ncbi:cytochrome P450 [Aspergillus pseudotamarii]|uniref:Cytochrome P450 n=1 Tax=Aspergillus pseudotamarii TaxID=132259 RepID=A0A5N6SCH8_ASPPS|nr:cytochrome P450 [Aspergillus pseudotamarii]KAE8131361.1 cytochrome P450 [Aspergillus pseudotamarii]
MGDQKALRQAMVTADVLEQEKTATRLQMETLNIIAGATETTARALAVGVSHVAHKPSLLLQPRDELRTVMPLPDSPASWTQLEQLPYLAGVVNESLRLFFGFINRSARVYRTILWCTKALSSPKAPVFRLLCTPISQSPYFVCMGPSSFPHPEDSNPDRWVQAARDGINLHRYLIVFSKGSWHCLGINFAVAEIYLAIATVARRFNLVSYQMTVEQLQMKRDLGFAAPETGLFTVRAKSEACRCPAIIFSADLPATVVDMPLLCAYVIRQCSDNRSGMAGVHTSSVHSTCQLHPQRDLQEVQRKGPELWLNANNEVEEVAGDRPHVAALQGCG